MSIKDVCKKIIEFIVVGVASIVGYLLICRKDTGQIETVAQEEKEKEREKLEETNASDIVAESPNQSDIQQSIEQQQAEFRERVRYRFNKEL